MHQHFPLPVLRQSLSQEKVIDLHQLRNLLQRRQNILHGEEQDIAVCNRLQMDLGGLGQVIAAHEDLPRPKGKTVCDIPPFRIQQKAPEHAAHQDDQLCLHLARLYQGCSFFNMCPLNILQKPLNLPVFRQVQ